MYDSVQPYRRQPTRLLCPWDSPGKNTGVGCHFLLQCMKVKSEREVAQSCPTRSNPMDCSPPGSSIHGIFQARVLEWGGPPNSGRTKLPKNAPTSQLRANVQRSHKLRNAHAFWSHLPLKEEKEMATHSSILAWRIPGMGEPGGLPSLGSHRVGHD